MPLAALDWTQIVVSLIASLPAIIAAVAALGVRRAVRTPSGTRIGTQVENAHHVSLSNAYRLEVLRRNLGAPEPFERAAAAPAPDTTPATEPV